ncbi:MAG: hypothetical protein EPN38_04140 [Rhodanobacteraceae bacterium]|nr:MAG: hypothetical protein EPN38_04140 [Rhodanobacteraceae bacterium]
MRKLWITTTATLIGLALAGCSSGQPDATTAAATSSPLDHALNHVLDRAATQLQTEDLTLDNKHDIAPEGKITPQGDLLIAGKPVPLTSAQRSEVLAYRQQAIAVGEQGIAIGRSGAALGLQAASTAIAAVFSGKSGQEVKQQLEAKATGIRESALKLCRQLPAMMAAQQKLATDVPAFRPYATITQHDVSHCMDDAVHGGNATSGAATSAPRRTTH